MRELIDKAVVAAEIKRRINGLKDCHADTVAGYAGEVSGLERLLSFLNTLEVKEVNEEPVSKDLEEAATKYARKQLSNPDYPTYNDEYEMECAFEAGAQWQKQQDQLTIELAESEDEKARKRIIALVNAHGQGMYKDDMLAWLENIPYTIDREKRKGFHLGYKAALEKQGEKQQKTPIWKHWKDGIAGNGEGKPIYLIKYGHTYSLSSCLCFECDYIKLSELDKLMLEKQETSYTKRDVDDAYLKGISDAKNELEKQGEQEPAKTVKWSPQEESCICQLESLVKEQWRHAKKVNNAVDIKKMQELMFFLKTLNPNKKPQRMISAEAKEAMYDKPVWSEEDELVIKDIEEAITNYWHGYTQGILLDWLKSLKQRIKGE